MEDSELETLLNDIELDRVERGSTSPMKANQRFAACMLVVSCQLLVAKKIIYKTDVLSSNASDRHLTEKQFVLLPDMLRMLDETFQAHISVASALTAQPLEIRQPDYPIVALQQFARNAVMHRSYEGTHAPVRIYWFGDRIEIHNPGGPFGQVNRQNFGQEGITDYRNPHLAEAMKNLGYVQKFGAGISLARAQLQKNGNPPPEFVVEDTRLLVIIRKKP